MSKPKLKTAFVNLNDLNLFLDENLITYKTVCVDCDLLRFHVGVRLKEDDNHTVLFYISYASEVLLMTDNFEQAIEVFKKRLG